MNFFFLGANVVLLMWPFLLTLDKQHFRVHQLKSALLPALFSAALVGGLMVVLHGLRVWQYTDLHLGALFKGIPFEHFLLNFSFAFAALNTYQYLNVKYPNNSLQRYSFAISNLLLGLCVAFIFFGYTKWYSVVTFPFLFLVLFGVEYLGKLRFMYRFYRLFVFCLLPSWIMYGVLVGLPVLHYELSATVKMELLGIPIENHFLLMAQLLAAVFLMEWRQYRKANGVSRL